MVPSPLFQLYLFRHGIGGFREHRNEQILNMSESADMNRASEHVKRAAMEIGEVCRLLRKCVSLSTSYVHPLPSSPSQHAGVVGSVWPGRKCVALSSLSLNVPHALPHSRRVQVSPLPLPLLMHRGT